MSNNLSYLALRLEGPLQSWGFDSQYNRRNTGLMPTKSAIAGMCCAALGFSRGSEEEKEFLGLFSETLMTSIAISHKGAKKESPVRRLQDYHTVGGGYDPNNASERGSITTVAESGKPRAKNGQSIAVLTHRQYLTDASFGVLLEGEKSFLENIANALNDPVWGVWFGRKTCIPTAPVFAGLTSECDTALKLLIGEEPLDSFTRQIEVVDFSEGKDSLPDVPVSFLSEKREFSLRRVKTLQAGETSLKL